MPRDSGVYGVLSGDPGKPVETIDIKYFVYG